MGLTMTEMDAAGKMLDEPHDAIHIIKEAVDGLYHFRDHFFEQQSVDDAVKKPAYIKDKLRETLVVIEKNEKLCKHRSRVLTYKGKALNIIPQYNNEAFELLSKAVKLDPHFVEAWNELGECYWKKGDIEGAKNCFTGALGREKNKISLRNLSMVLRQIGKNSTEKQAFSLEGVEKAKEAVQLDMTDGTSWSVLGNAYLSLFFSCGQNPKVLKQCMQAYSKAEQDPVANNNPDLHFNRAVAYRFEEEYQRSLDGFCRALSLEPSWTAAQEKIEDLLKYITKVSELINLKGKLKGKRLRNMVSAIVPRDLGPYEGGSYKGKHGESIKLDPVLFTALKTGINEEKVVLGKVVCSVPEDGVPFTFCMVDKDETCYSVTVYNMAQSQGVIIGDSVAIPEPFVQDVNLTHNDKTMEYRSIRVDTPMVMVVNGRKWGKDKEAFSFCTLLARTDAT